MNEEKKKRKEQRDQQKLTTFADTATSSAVKPGSWNVAGRGGKKEEGKRRGISNWGKIAPPEKFCSPCCWGRERLKR